MYSPDCTCGDCELIRARHAAVDADGPATAGTLDARMAAHAAIDRQDIANRCGPESARTVPFDTGVVHGPEPLWRVGQPMPAIVADRRMEGQIAAERAWRETQR